jgi:hypothetical protein
VYSVAPSSDVTNTRGCPEFDASLWSNVYVSPRMNPSVGVSSPLITNLLFATVTVNVVGELALFAVSSAEKLVGILIRFSIRFLRDSRLLNRAPILEFVTPLYLFKVTGELCRKIKVKRRVRYGRIGRIECYAWGVRGRFVGYRR